MFLMYNSNSLCWVMWDVEAGRTLALQRLSCLYMEDELVVGRPNRGATWELRQMFSRSFKVGA